MTPTTMGIIELALKMGVGGTVSIASIYALNWFNNHDFKSKKKGGENNDTNDSSSIRKKLAERNQL